MPNFEEDFYCQTCGYEHRNCKCNGDPRDARIAELEATIERVRAVLAEGDGEGWVIIQKAKVRAALTPTTEGSE